MTSKERINMLEDIKVDISKNFIQICGYHGISEEILYEADKNITNIFDWMIEFYKQDLAKDNTSKKALMIGMANTISNLDVPMITSFMHDSPIEFLLYSALKISMPSHVWQKAFLMPQVSVCEDKYLLDIALMDRRDPQKDGTEGIPIVGIECDGYDYHYNDSEKAKDTQVRAREIQMSGVTLFSYTGKDIYHNCTELATEFWKYVEKYIYPSQI